MDIVSIIFWIGFGLLLLLGSLFQYHEAAVGICALVIGIIQLVGLLRRA